MGDGYLWRHWGSGEKLAENWKMGRSVPPSLTRRALSASLKLNFPRGESTRISMKEKGGKGEGVCGRTEQDVGRHLFGNNLVVMPAALICKGVTLSSPPPHSRSLPLSASFSPSSMTGVQSPSASSSTRRAGQHGHEASVPPS
jgi:hypothetical protein